MSNRTESFNKVSEYNGWTNKPTWLVALWVDNDQYLQETVREQSRSLGNFEFRNWLDNSFNDENDLGANLNSDLLSWALAYVDWDSLAEHYINEEA
jgi:hypothetical protein